MSKKEDAMVTVRTDRHGKGLITIDGKEITCVESVSINVEAGKPNTVTLTLTPATIIAEGVFNVTALDKTVAEYKQGEPEIKQPENSAI